MSGAWSIGPRQPYGRVIPQLLGAVVFPEFVALPGGSQFPLADLARYVADDNHPGDNVVGPRYLRTSAVGVVSIPALHTTVSKAGGSLVLTGDIARACCTAHDDQLQGLAAYAFEDARIDPPPGRCKPEVAALILVCGVLMYEAKRIA